MEKNGMKTGFTVNAESGSFFTVLDAGSYRLTRVGAEVAAVPPVNAVCFDGIDITARPETGTATLLLPFKSLLDSKKIKYDASLTTLTYTLDGEKVTLENGKATVLVGALQWPLAEKVRRTGTGEWLVPVEAAGPLLNALLFRDRWNGSSLLKSLAAGEKTKFFALNCSDGEAAAWRQLWETGRSRWMAPGRDIKGEIVLRRPETLTGIELLRGDGNIHRARLKVEISADGQAFKTVFDGESAGTAIAYEGPTFPAQPVRIIRITFMGNNENEWNSLLGARLVGPSK